MTLRTFVLRNAFRNKRRSLLTMVSISFSLLLLTLMMSIWRTFYIDQGPPNATKTMITRDRVSLAFFLPAYYRDKIRTIPGVVAVAPMTYFGNVYKDDRATNSFAQVVTDPDEYLKVAPDKIVPPDQLLAWQRDRTGAMVDIELAKKFGWKIGDHLTLQSPYFPVHPEVTLRAIYTIDPPVRSLIFNTKYLEESDRKSKRLNSSHDDTSYAVFCLKKKRTGARGHAGSIQKDARSLHESLRSHP